MGKWFLFYSSIQKCFSYPWCKISEPNIMWNNINLLEICSYEFQSTWFFLLFLMSEMFKNFQSGLSNHISFSWWISQARVKPFTLILQSKATSASNIYIIPFFSCSTSSSLFTSWSHWRRTGWSWCCYSGNFVI